MLAIRHSKHIKQSTKDRSQLLRLLMHQLIATCPLQSNRHNWDITRPIMTDSVVNIIIYLRAPIVLIGR
jgi:hypothetical protein